MMMDEEKKQSRDSQNNGAHTELSAMREQIDYIDVQISLLLTCRFSLAQKLMEVKNDLNIPIADGKREAEVLERVLTVPDEPEIASAVASVYKEILHLSRQLQMKCIRERIKG
jgi:chorismate mutase